MNDISVVIRTKNNASKIKEVIENAFKIGDEVVVVDSGSIDDTVSIAKHSGAKIFTIPEESFDFSKSANIGIDNSSGRYILLLDSDETIEPKYIETIKKRIEDKRYDVFRAIALNVSPSGNVKRSYAFRLFKKGDYKFQGSVYEFLYPIRDSSTGNFVIKNIKNFEELPIKILREKELSKILQRRELAGRELQELLKKEPSNVVEATTMISRLRSLHRDYVMDYNNNTGILRGYGLEPEGIELEAYKIEDKIMNVFDKGVNFDSKDPFLRLEMASFFESSKKIMYAMATLFSLDSQEISSSNYLHKLAFFQSCVNNYELALSTIDKAIGLDPNDMGQYQLKGNILSMMGKKEETKKVERIMDSIFPEQSLTTNMKDKTS